MRWIVLCLLLLSGLFADFDGELVAAREALVAGDLQRARLHLQRAERLSFDPSLPRRIYHLTQQVLLGVEAEYSYTFVRETDPNIGQPTVNDQYSYGLMRFFWPCSSSDHLEVTVQQARQNEQNLVGSERNNYAVHLERYQLLWRHRLLPHCKTEVFAAVQKGTQQRAIESLFPMQHAVLVSPGVKVFYEDDELYLHASVAQDSFVYKNYSEQQADLMVTRSCELRAQYALDHVLHPHVGTSLKQTVYRDGQDNRLNGLYLWTWLTPDVFHKIVSVGYEFYVRGFEALNENYYTYKRQENNNVWLQLQTQFTPYDRAEVGFEMGTLFTKNIFQPIGTFIFSANRQFLSTTKLRAALSHQLGTQGMLEVSASYYRNTLPYSEKMARATLWLYF